MHRSTGLATIATLISAVLWFFAIPPAVISFNRSNVVAYSCWNHVLSELGFPYASRLTWVYNGTLAIGGLLLLPTFYALRNCLQTWLGAVAKGFGVVTCLALSVLGLLGLRQDVFGGPYIFLRFLEIHLAVADVFFLGWLATVTLFTISFCRRWGDYSTRPVAVVGIFSMLLYPLFLVVAFFANPMSVPLRKSLRDPAFRAIIKAPNTIAILSPWLDCHRPPVWWPAALEWALAWSIWLWFGAALWFLWKNAVSGDAAYNGEARRSPRRREGHEEKTEGN